MANSGDFNLEKGEEMHKVRGAVGISEREMVTKILPSLKCLARGE